VNNKNNLNRRTLLKGLGGLSATTLTGSFGLAGLLVSYPAAAQSKPFVNPIVIKRAGWKFNVPGAFKYDVDSAINEVAWSLKEGDAKVAKRIMGMSNKLAYARIKRITPQVSPAYWFLRTMKMDKSIRTSEYNELVAISAPLAYCAAGMGAYNSGNFSRAEEVFLKGLFIGAEMDLTPKAYRKLSLDQKEKTLKEVAGFYKAYAEKHRKDLEGIQENWTDVNHPYHRLVAAHWSAALLFYSLAKQKQRGHAEIALDKIYVSSGIPIISYVVEKLIWES